MRRKQKFMIHRGDYDFSRILWRVDELTRKIYTGYHLTNRDQRFLDLVAQAYPAQPGDGCMVFHVNNCRDTNRRLNQ